MSHIWLAGGICHERGAKAPSVITCSVTSRQSSEPLTGTAPTATTWLLLEQPGPWGARALADSRLDPRLGRALEQATAGTGVRTALIRRPGRRDQHAPRRVFLAHTHPGASWIRTARLTEPWHLLDLDFAALGGGAHGDLWEPHRGGPLTLVCTNGRRDRCCAVLGRPLVRELAADLADVWEITHLGGHRFAPTLLVLPFGYAYGRMTAPRVRRVLRAAGDGRVVLEGCRGRSPWSRPGQVAELAVRRRTGEARADALTVSREAPSPQGDRPGWTVTVSHRDGRRWRVTVTSVSGPAAPASCGAEAEPRPRLAVTAVDGPA